MSTGSVTNATSLEELSALADGELDPAAVAAACACWHGDPSVRASWHAYHLIGDVLRSDDLAAEPARDAAFLSELRGRLVQEPVVLSPQPRAPEPAFEQRPPAPGVRSIGTRRWMVSSAVAAGFIAIVGAYTLLRPVAPSAPGVATLARADGPKGIAVRTDDRQVAEASDSNAARPPALATDRLLRDARLDAYLAAHKQFAGSSALGVPSAFLRSATADASGR